MGSATSGISCECCHSTNQSAYAGHATDCSVSSHGNSIDKCPDGDYVFSARHCDTIYKISHKDGSIVWRLGGKQPSFDMGDVLFSRQHDIRCTGQNGTHTQVTMLDNAKGQDKQEPTWDWSRGLQINVDEVNKKASLAAYYDHPYKDHAKEKRRYAPRRGNMQLLDNGNVFMGWSERALQSEHAPDGALLMEAVFKADWIGSYRNYKFPFVGRPATKPDVHAKAQFEDEELYKDLRTKVYVSWNGDTEVRTWELWGSRNGNDTMEKLDQRTRMGFETTFEYPDYAKYVRLDGLDNDGNVIGSSGEVKTTLHPTLPAKVDEPGEETDDNLNDGGKAPRILGMPIAAFIVLFAFGCVGSTSVLLLAWFGKLPLPWAMRARESVAKRWPFGRKREGAEYKRLAGQDQDEEMRESLTAQKSRGQIERDPSDEEAKGER